MDSQLHYKVLGLMSGTSLDGLDIAYCTFRKDDGRWSYTLDKAATIKYSSAWITKLSTAHKLSAEALLSLHASYGKFLGDSCRKFITQHKLEIDFIASHGHTVFHQPHNSFTFQLGEGQAIHVASKLPVVYDFRSLDVALGGQGAPLVPAGDKILFNDFDVCLNLGGIANLSHDVNGNRKAFDICFVNMGLNFLAAQANKQFDKGGSMAAEGRLIEKLLQSIEKVYNKYRKKRPSLGREIFEKEIKPLINNKKISLADRLHTFTVSAANEIVAAFPTTDSSLNVLCTGGGAYNSFLILKMLDLVSDQVSVIIPDDDVVKFKEALIFAFLGVLRVNGEVNCLKSVTGASRDCSGGVMNGF